MHDPTEDATYADSHPRPLENREYSEEEAREYFDAMARHYLNMSGDEFRKRWHRGEYADDPDRPGVITLAMLLPMVERQEVAP